MTNATPTPAAQAPAASTPWNTGLVPLSRAAFDVLAERQRQIETEGWTPEHDDRHGPATLAVAAGYYALCTDAFPNAGQPPLGWPWDASWWKPKDFRRDLQRAGALILAAMECHDRQHGEAPVERPVPHMIDAVRAVLARHLDPVGISKAEAIAEIIAIVGDPREGGAA
ncbi:hypothetical protein [Bordetella hinzii]|uniref:hypothetical protein n=1 Tax=Bordetella hinzii TaxID=103855 RepID=UPI00076491AD|nr:hypothetical protein [Bordetella hinzii]KXA71088.1 hypothetical protein AXA74_20515 [Bordetella hinzii LMG 13501]VEH23199.1 Uncharacterised protein [Bordetella hinzii]VEH33555.1 Uncharacterised protein [Bordetella hinzii]